MKLGLTFGEDYYNLLHLRKKYDGIMANVRSTTEYLHKVDTRIDNHLLEQYAWMKKKIELYNELVSLKAVVQTAYNELTERCYVLPTWLRLLTKVSKKLKLEVDIEVVSVRFHYQFLYGDVLQEAYELGIEILKEAETLGLDHSVFVGSMLQPNKGASELSRHGGDVMLQFHWHEDKKE